MAYFGAVAELREVNRSSAHYNLHYHDIRIHEFEWQRRKQLLYQDNRPTRCSRDLRDQLRLDTCGSQFRTNHMNFQHDTREKQALAVVALALLFDHTHVIHRNNITQGDAHHGVREANSQHSRVGSARSGNGGRETGCAAC